MAQFTLPAVYPILDTATLDRLGLNYVEAAEAMIEGGARILQMRHKALWSREIFALAAQISRLCQAAGILFVVNDRADYAAVLGAAIHVGQEDLTPVDARRVVGAAAILGFSTHSVEQVLAAEDLDREGSFEYRSFTVAARSGCGNLGGRSNAGGSSDASGRGDSGGGDRGGSSDEGYGDKGGSGIACESESESGDRSGGDEARGIIDYLAFGPVFSTVSKERPDPTVGISGLKAIRALTCKPLVAIGGITRDNAFTCWNAGADSVAIIADLYPNPCTKATLRDRMTEWQNLTAS